MITDSFFRNYSNSKIHKIVQNQKMRLQVLYAKTINKIFKTQKNKQTILNIDKVKANNNRRSCYTPQVMYRYTNYMQKSQNQTSQQFMNEKDDSKQNVFHGKRKSPITVKQIKMTKNLNILNLQSRPQTRNKIFTGGLSQDSLFTPNQNKQINHFLIDCPLKSVQILEKTKRQKQKNQALIFKEQSLIKNNYFKKEEKDVCNLNMLIPKLNQLKYQKNIQNQQSGLKTIFNKKQTFIRKPRSSYRVRQNAFRNEISNLENSLQRSLKKSVERGQRFQTAIARKYRKTYNQFNNSKLVCSMDQKNQIIQKKFGRLDDWTQLDDSTRQKCLQIKKQIA